MPYNPHLHHRHSIRLKGYDYSWPGTYFLTICVQNKECLFGDIVNGKMILNEFGKIVQEEWLRTTELRPNFISDEMVVMPNHLHGIIIIWPDRRGESHSPHESHSPPAFHSPHESPPSASHSSQAPHSEGECNSSQRNPDFKSPVGTIGAMVRGFKAAATKRINEIRGTAGNRIFQRNYYEHIIRDDKSYWNIKEYIIHNPEKWDADRFNPINP